MAGARRGSGAQIALLAAGLAACGEEAPQTGVRLELLLEAGAARPEVVELLWFAEGREDPPISHRVPTAGVLPPSGPLGTVQITTRPGAAGMRRLLLRGRSGDELVASAALRLTLRPGAIVDLPVRLSSTPLPDGDGDGLPDLIDDDAGPTAPP
jgi:hypothetical protein